ncbi:MAG: SUMF1/EgtB/PvdO family nonheme iron enzyme, partial [Dinghuibacter sp.]|nr:SUMF1/EgtB/PvdO family nonheme iron enzyme [Dinghuibacter sp.]
MYKKMILIPVVLLLTITAGANNISVSNLSKAVTNTADNYILLQFTLSWENSWRDAVNHDAAWVFIKYRISGTTGAWAHATLNYINGSNDGHTIPAGAAIRTPPDGKGVFVYRNAPGSGNTSFANIQLRWNYGADGVNDNDLTDVSVSAIEMVYVPQGAFWLGDGSNIPLHGQFENGVSGLPVQITSENALTLGGGAPGSIGNNNRTGMANNGLSSLPPFSIDDFNDVLAQTLPAAFPKGFNAFYCMKYEITQGQYTDFLNKLSPAQFASRYDAFNYNSNHGGFTQTRYNITGTHPNMTTITPELPAVYVEWYDAAAYADWAALRPITEMEFEKACRGTAAPVSGEYAWGTATINTNSYFPILNAGQTNEAAGGGYSTTVGNAWYDQTRAFDAAVRVGIFAAHPSNTNRVTAGATY